VLALKALSLGADRIPDKFWHSVPGGYFRPPDAKDAKKPKKKSRNKSEQRESDRGRRRSTRERSASEYSDYSEHDDSDYEREQRRKNRRRRAKSLGRRSMSRSSSHGGNQERARDGTERGDPFPPPQSEYRPYDPRDYAPPSAPPPGASMANAYHEPYDRRASSARPDYGYPPQVNSASRSRSVTVPLQRPPSLLSQSLRSTMTSRPTSTFSTRPPSSVALPPLNMPSSPYLNTLRSGTPLTAAFSPSYEPPLAAMFNRPTSNPLQPSSLASRYTPGVGYNPSPAPMQTPLPPPNPGYTPYVPAAYVSESPAYTAPGNTYPSPPFYRQDSPSQPSVAQSPYPNGHNQMAAFIPPDRHSSTSSSHHRRHGDGKRNRARSVDHHARSHSRVTDKVRDRLESLDVHDKNLAASVGGALAGGLAGRNLGHGTLSTLIGAGIGALGGRELEKRHET
jgi:hypothetical protein